MLCETVYDTEYDALHYTGVQKSDSTGGSASGR